MKVQDDIRPGGYNKQAGAGELVKVSSMPQPIRMEELIDDIIFKGSVYALVSGYIKISRNLIYSLEFMVEQMCFQIY